MKKLFGGLWLSVGLTMATVGYGQAFDTEQLILDVEKLVTLKQTLDDLKKGYQDLDAAYTRVRDIAKGSFDLHKAFLDGLLAVSPGVRNYVRIPAILDLQRRMLTRYQGAWGSLGPDAYLLPSERAEIGQAGSGMLDESSLELAHLTDILTDRVLRADDGERMRDIDGIYNRMEKRAKLLDGLLDAASLLSGRRRMEAAERMTVKKLYGIEP